MEGDSPGLETAACAALLQERFSLVAERHAEDLHHAEAQLRGALKDLELVKQQSERELERRAGQLRREYAAAMAALERRFLTDAEALQARLREGLAQESQLCQAGIDARAQELLASLGSGLRSGSDGPGGSPLLGSLGGNPAAAERRPVSRSPAACKAAPPSPPPPALAAASQAIAARRHSLPPSPGNLGSPSLQRPAISLTAASGRAAHQQAGSPAPAARPGTSASASPASGSPALPAAPPGMPNTAAALLDKVAQPPATQPPPPPWGSVPAAPGARSPPTKHGVPAAAAAPESTWGARASHNLAHESSSEYEDDSFLDGGEEDSEEAGMATSRAPSVKVVNPPRVPALPTHSGGSTPRAVSFADLGQSSRPSSGRQVHLNCAAGRPGSPAAALRSYSPCSCRETGLGAGSPRSAILRSPACGGSWLRSGQHDFDSN